MQGILMKPDMIQATVERRKTNTRRAEAGLREINQNPDDWEAPIKVVNNAYPAKVGDWLFQHKTQLALCVIARPRYHVGETVYIKEVWAVNTLYDHRKPRDIPVGYSQSPIWYSNDRDIDSALRGRWRSPLFMLEWAARHFILIEAVRAERLQEITEGDAIKEGVEECSGLRIHPESKEYETVSDYTMGFVELWDSINSKYPFDSNPWEFAYQFRLMIGRR